MNKVYYILFMVMILILDTLAILAYKAMDEPMHYRYYYEYIGLDRQIGRSSTCYTIEDGRDFCRDVKNIYPVIKYKKMKERK